MARLRVSGKAIETRKKKWTKPYAALGATYGAAAYGLGAKLAKLSNPKAAALAGVGALVGAGGGLLSAKMHGSAYERQKARSLATGKKQTTLRKVGRFLSTGTAPGMSWSFAKTKKTKTT